MRVCGLWSLLDDLMAKILIKKMKGKSDHLPYESFIDVIKSRPFITSDRALLTHRVRAIRVFKMNKIGLWPRWDTVIQFACGGRFYLDSKTGCSGHSDNAYYLLDEPKNNIICKKCEENLEKLDLKAADDLVGRKIHQVNYPSISACWSNKNEQVVRVS